MDKKITVQVFKNFKDPDAVVMTPTTIYAVRNRIQEDIDSLYTLEDFLTFCEKIYYESSH